MGFELQIREWTLGQVVARMAQRHFFASCFPPFGEGAMFIDRVNVADRPPEFTPRDGALRIQVPIEVYAVSREAVLAAPNGVPATKSAAARLGFELSTTSPTTIDLRCVDAELGEVGALVGAPLGLVSGAIVDGIGTVMSTDIGPDLARLGLAATESRVDLADGTVCIRMDPTGPASNRLPGQRDGGLFLDAATVQRMVSSAAGLDSIGDLPFSEHAVGWDPQGDLPRVVIAVSGRIPTHPIGAVFELLDVAAPDTFSMSAKFTCDLRLASPDRLQVSVHWQLHVRLGSLIPAFVDRAVRGAVASLINRHLQRRPGISVRGDREFTWETGLGEFGLGPTTFTFASLTASAAGMTFGGAVDLPADVGRSPVTPQVSTFAENPPHYSIEWCDLSMVPPRGIKEELIAQHADEIATQTRTVGEASWSSLGPIRLCGLEVVRGGPSIAPYLTSSDIHVRYSLPMPVAREVTGPVQVLLRTSRGTRLLDFGAPSETGDVSIQFYCFDPTIDLALAAGADTAGRHFDKHGIPLPVLNPLTDGDPKAVPLWEPRERRFPPEEPSPWEQQYLDRQSVVAIQSVRLSGLTPGESVRLDLGVNSALVTADAEGQAMLPVVLTANSPRMGKLTTLSPDSAPNLTVVDSTVYAWEAAVAPAYKELTIDGSGRAVLIDETTDRVLVYDAAAASQRWSESSRDALTGLRGEELLSTELAGLSRVTVLPGLKEQPIGLALADSGTKLIVDLRDAGTPRIAGFYRGPLAQFQSVDDWAMLAGARHNSIFMRM